MISTNNMHVGSWLYCETWPPRNCDRICSLFGCNNHLKWMLVQFLGLLDIA